MESSKTTAPVLRSTADTEAGWRRAQAWAGLLLASFVALHLANVVAGVLPGGYDAMQRVLRAAYQFPPVELALFAALGVHLVAGVRAMVRRRGKRAPTTLRTRIQRAASWVLLVFIGLHVLAARGASLFEGVHPGAIGIAFAFRWMPAFFWPYYYALAFAGAVHLTLGVPLALGMIGRPAARAWTHGPRIVALVLPPVRSSRSGSWVSRACSTRSRRTPSEATTPRCTGAWALRGSLRLDSASAPTPGLRRGADT